MYCVDRRDKMMKGIKKTVALFLTLIMVLALASVPAFAKTKTIKMKGAAFTTRSAEIARSAKKVKKGSYILKTNKKKGGFLKFTATSTKTYTFTISHYSTKKYYCNGYWYIMTQAPNNPDYYYSTKVKTQGGTNSSLYICSKSNTYGKKVYRFLKSRYGKIKLKKGQTIYIYLEYTGGNAKLKIK